MKWKRAGQDDRRSMGAVALSLGFAALALCGGVNRGAAEDVIPDAPYASPGWFDAPIGHVQPTLRDLPPAVARSEGKRTKQQKNFDKKLQICRGC